MGQVIAVTSGKGGTGKTTICAALATCLAAEGFRVLCIDADMGLRNLDIALGMAELAPISFLDVMSRRSELREASAHPKIPGLWLLTAPMSEDPEEIDPQDFGALVAAVRAKYDYCLIDSPAGVGPGFRLATLFADRVLVIATPDPSSLRDAAGTADRLRLMGKDELKLVVNRVTPSLFRALKWTVDDMMDEVGLSLLGLVPEDEQVVLAAATDQPLILCTDRGAALGCLHIARRLQGLRVPLMKIR